MSNKEAATLYQRNKFNVDGLRLESHFKDKGVVPKVSNHTPLFSLLTGYIWYNVKVIEQINHEDDPKSPCRKNYLLGHFHQVF